MLHADWRTAGCVGSKLGASGSYSSIPALRIADWPGLPMRGAHIHQLGEKEPSAVFYAQANKMARHKMNFFSAMTTSDIPLHLDTQAIMQVR